MITYIAYEMKNGKILRHGICSRENFLSQADKEKGENVIEGIANDVTQKVEFNGFDEDGQPINPRVVDKTAEEIELSKPPIPPEIPEKQKPAYITNEQWQAVLTKLSILEAKLK